MNTKYNLDSVALRLLYLKYKEIIAPISIIIVALVLFISITIPQINSLLTAGERNKSDLDRLTILKNNLNLLSATEDKTLDSYSQLINTALPNHKDFEGVLNAVSVASKKAGVTLGNYEFKVGDLSKIDEEGGFPNLKLNLTVSGSIINVNSFMKELEKTLPISEITEINISNNFSNITAVFYYKASQLFTYNDNSPIPPISNQDSTIINKLSSFSNNLTSSSSGSLSQ